MIIGVFPFVVEFKFHQTRHTPYDSTASVEREEKNGELTG